MARNGDDESFAAYAPDSSGAAAAEEDINDVAREIAKAMPWLKPEEIDALRKEQELIESGPNKKTMVDAAVGASFKSKTHSGGKVVGEKEFADYVVDETTRPPIRNTGSPRKLVHDSDYAESSDIKSDRKISTVAKTGIAKNMYSRRGMQEEDESAAALPSGKQIQAPATVGQWNVPSFSNRSESDGDRVGAVAIEGPGGTNRTLYDGALSDNNRNQSLISAELVTESETLDTNQIRQMLRSELQAELQNNIVRAEVITPAAVGDAISSNEDVEAGVPETPIMPPNETSSSEQPRSKKRYCIIGALFVLILGAAGGAAAGALLAGGGDDDSTGDANANIVGATDGPVIAPSTSLTVAPTVQVTFAPVVHPSVGEGQPPNPTPPPTDAGEDKSPSFAPSRWPSQFPTNTPSILPTIWAPTPPPATLPPTRAPTDWPTRAPTASPTTLPPADTDPPTRAPTKAPTFLPTDYLTDPPTRAPIVRPTDVETNPPTAKPTDAQVVVTDPPTRKPTRDPTRPPTEEEIASPSSV